MQRLIIRNIGPVKEADINLKKVNVFIGPQSSGKSTVAKIISFCTWLEKNKHELNGAGLFSSNVIDKLLSYHRMEGYMTEDSHLFYQGDNIAFAYNWEDTVPLDFGTAGYHEIVGDGKQRIFLSDERLSNPKVLYIPAERNFVSVVPNLQKYDDSNDSLHRFIIDWFEAKRSINKQEPLNLIDLGMSFYSDEDEDYIEIENGRPIKLRNASSGLQSVTPLLVVADYLTNGIYKKERPFSVEEQDVLNKILHQIAVLGKDFSEFQRRLSGFLQGKVYTHTQFVIEEPEQNLYPTEQYKLIEHLMAIINHGKQHKMTITTHSPYIVNFLNVLLRRPDDSSSFISHEDLNVYLISDGELSDLMMHDVSGTRWAVDTSVLNAAMDSIAAEFESLA